MFDLQPPRHIPTLRSGVNDEADRERPAPTHCGNSNVDPTLSESRVRESPQRWPSARAERDSVEGGSKRTRAALLNSNGQGKWGSASRGASAYSGKIRVIVRSKVKDALDPSLF